MFTGEAIGRRVNLSGTRSLMDKSSLLEKQKREREEREKIRIQINACMRIQSVWRAIQVRQRLTEEWSRIIKLADSQNMISYLWGLDMVSNDADFEISIRGIQLEKLAPYIARVPPGARKILFYRSLIHAVLVTGGARSILQDVILTCVQEKTIGKILKNRIDLKKFFQLLVVPLNLVLNSMIHLDHGDARLFQKCFIYSLNSPNWVVSSTECPLELASGTEDFDMIPSQVDQVRVSVNMTKELLFGAHDISTSEILVKCVERIKYLQPECALSVEELIVASKFFNIVLEPSDISLVQLVNFSGLSDDVIFRIATRSNACQILADDLIKELGEKAMEIPDEKILHFINAFTVLYSSVVRGIHTGTSSIVTAATIEKLFPLLNKCGYRMIVSPRGTIVSQGSDSALFQLIRAIYDKKFLFKNLNNESVWVIEDSVNHIPVNFNSFEVIDRLRREMDQDEEDEESDVVMTSAVGVAGPFERLIEFMPHIIPFRNRVRILASALAEDKRSHFLASRSSLGFPQRSRGYLKRIRRDFILEDGLQVFDPPCGSGTLKDILQIEFVSGGQVEAGIDGGGLFKEFIHEWTRGVMNPEFGLFRQLNNGRISPASTAYIMHSPLVADRMYTALGRAVGKALYDMVLLDTHLGESFLNRVIGRSFAIEQLAEVDESLYRNLKFVGTDCENVEDLALTFSVSVGTETGAVAGEVHLVPGGSNIAVTNENKIRYILLSSWYHLAKQLERPAQAFAAGFNEVVPMSWLRMFSPHEINLLISGEQRRGFDVEDLRLNVVYGGGYTERSETVVMFWELLRELGDDDKSTFLQFVTSSPRPPLLGFRVMHPKFAINRVPEPDRLPTASTCNNLFKLPDYRSKKLMKEKLIAALYSHGGFDLS